MKRLLACVCLLALAAACSGVRQDVVIDDVALGSRAGYRIEQVDGVPPTRREGTFVSYVPFVLTTPGEHELLLQRDSSAEATMPVTQRLKVTVASGEYVLRRRGRTVDLVKRNKYHNAETYMEVGLALGEAMAERLRAE